MCGRDELCADRNSWECCAAIRNKFRGGNPGREDCRASRGATAALRAIPDAL